MIQFSDIDPQYSRTQEEDFNLIRDNTRGVYVEVGTFHGASAYAATQNAIKIWTIDVYDWQPKVTNDPKITFFRGTSEDFAKSVPNYTEIDTLFIDGSHEYDYIKKDIEALEPLVKKGGIIMFDDYKKESATGVYSAVQDYLRRCSPKILQDRTEKCSILMVQKV